MSNEPMPAAASDCRISLCGAPDRFESGVFGGQNAGLWIIQTSETTFTDVMGLSVRS